MWRLGFIAVLAVVLDLTSSAAIGHGAPLERLKRSPPFCPPYYPPPHHPPFWPPPPPHFFRHGYGSYGQNSQGNSYVGGLTAADQSNQGGQTGQDHELGKGQTNAGQYGQEQELSEGSTNAGQFGQGLFNQGEQKQAYADANSQAGPKNEGGPISFPSPPCDKCNTKGENSAISNAQSESGSAIAVAISGRNKT